MDSRLRGNDAMRCFEIFYEFIKFDPTTNIFQFKEVFMSDSPQLPDRVKNLIRLKHHRIGTEETCAHWIERDVF